MARGGRDGANHGIDGSAEKVEEGEMGARC